MKRPLLTGTKRKIQVADGARLQCEGMATFDLQLGDIIVRKDFLVADIKDDILLGADILQKDPSGPADLLLSQDAMILRGHSVPLKQIILNKERNSKSSL